MVQVAQLLLMCDRRDLGLSIGSGDEGPAGNLAAKSDLEEPRIFLYDNYPGGIGFSRPLYEMHLPLLQRSRELIDGCPCTSGCPSCVGPEGNTGPHAKQVASMLLQQLLEGAPA
jgi:DEAD/DEAH box helicase domain-containing protein